MIRGHLNGPELEALLMTGSSGDEASSHDAQGHCEECSQCAALVSAHRSALREIESLNHLTANSERRDCPPEEQWLNLAAGLTQGGEAMKLLEHAAQCRACAQLLRESQGYLAAPSSEPLELKSSTPEWRRKMAEQMAARPAAVVPMPKKLRSPWIMTALVAAAVIVIAVVALPILKMIRQPDVGQLLAKAYSQNRTLEMRIPGAAYADLRQRRAGTQESLIADDSLEPSKMAVSVLCKKAPGSRECLLNEANLDLLAWRYQPALQELASIHQGTESRDFLMARALAEFEKGELEGQSRIYESTYGQAIEDLSKALKISPRNPVALYNRALIFEKLFMFESAIADWQELLKVETDSGWVAEARRHLDALQEKKNNRLNKLKRLNDPEQAAREVLESPQLTPRQTEALLDIAVNQWLPPGQIDSALAAKLLNKLARAMQENHQDDWLSDFLSAPGSPEGVGFLRSAIRAGARGDATGAERAARSAIHLFTRAGNAPGIMRSGLELVYALVQLAKTSECLKETSQLRSQLSRRQYPWLRIRLALEAAKCESAVSNFDAAQALDDDVLREAERYRYSTLSLYGLTFLVKLDAAEGRPGDSWKTSEAGLNIFWQEAYAAERGYVFYQTLEFGTEAGKQWHLAAALQREALTLIGQSDQKSAQGAAHFRLGVIAQMEGLLEEAANHLARAQAIFHALPAEGTNLIYQAEVEIALARLESERGHLPDASARLAQIEPYMNGIANTYVHLNYWTAKAEIERLRGNKHKEAEYWGRVVTIGNEGFQSLHSPTERWGWRREVGPAYVHLLELELEQPHDAIQALADWEAFRAAEHQKRFSEHGIYDVAAKMQLESRLRLLRRGSLVGFAVTGGLIHAWVADDRGVREASVRSDLGTLRSEIEEFYRLCSNPLSPLAETSRVGADLYQQLFGPIEQYLGAERTLFVEADDPLNGIAWAALTTRKGTYLGDAYELVSTPGLLYPSGVPNKRSTQVALVASPGTATFEGERYLPLAQAEEESQVLSRMFPETVYLKGEAANLREIIRHLPQADIFHFVGHAVSLEQGGELLVAGSGGGAVLSARSLADTRLPHCRVVVLAACSTAEAAQDITRNPDGLIPAFLQSGAKRVVASHWDVDSGVTFHLMRQFYSSINKGRDIAAALRDAQQYVRSQQATTAPYYWAAFEAFGPAD